MPLRETLGDGPPPSDPRPYRPKACPCCNGGLRWEDVVFCGRCEDHGRDEWCIPLKPVESRKEVPATYPRLFESA